MAMESGDTGVQEMGKELIENVNKTEILISTEREEPSEMQDLLYLIERIWFFAL